jgi:threonine synthase
MKFLSTRGTNECSFEQALFQGLAPDGGLYIPAQIPSYKGQNQSFNDHALDILSLYIAEDEIPTQELKLIIQKSFATFTHPLVTPIVPVGDNLVLELFHGPTCAFKDVALQLLGNLFEYFLVKRSGTRINILGATSGDTGSAAVAGIRSKDNINCFILFPNGRISSIQEQQMTSVLDSNIHNVAVNGTFDDCQSIVKHLFELESFRKKHNLAAVNSINWARILAQTIYYYYSFHMIRANPEYANRKIKYHVPTGNFGDILAGFYAKQMGLEISDLVIATNENDILYRFFQTGTYCNDKNVKQTPSPAMDILVSSNFERFLWYLFLGTSNFNSATFEQKSMASQTIIKLMKDLKVNGEFTVSPEILNKARVHFKANRVGNAETLACISSVYDQFGYVLDPHGSVAYETARLLKSDDIDICMATASPGKFPEAVIKATQGAIKFSDFAPKSLKRLNLLPTRVIRLSKDSSQLEQVIQIVDSLAI